jgi:L-alanine-DL-glutamate epimerase-like enolase superfamily enzyme
MARHLIDYGGVGFIQIDCGRIGGIGPAKKVADYAVGKGVTFVNHTFTSHLALSASLQPYAGLEAHDLCEYPVEPSPLGRDFTVQRLVPDADGLITLPESPGLAVEPNVDELEQYLQQVEIKIGGRTIFQSVPLR